MASLVPLPGPFCVYPARYTMTLRTAWFVPNNSDCVGRATEPHISKSIRGSTVGMLGGGPTRRIVPEMVPWPFSTPIALAVRATSAANIKRGIGLRRRIPVVKHEVDDHTCHRYIKPNRQRPARNPLVLVEPLAQRANQCEGRKIEGHDHCQYCV